MFVNINAYTANPFVYIQFCWQIVATDSSRCPDIFPPVFAAPLQHSVCGLLWYGDCELPLWRRLATLVSVVKCYSDFTLAQHNCFLDLSGCIGDSLHAQIKPSITARVEASGKSTVDWSVMSRDRRSSASMSRQRYRMTVSVCAERDISGVTDVCVHLPPTNVVVRVYLLCKRILDENWFKLCPTSVMLF